MHRDWATNVSMFLQIIIWVVSSVTVTATRKQYYMYTVIHLPCSCFWTTCLLGTRILAHLVADVSHEHLARVSWAPRGLAGISLSPSPTSIFRHGLGVLEPVRDRARAEGVAHTVSLFYQWNSSCGCSSAPGCVFFPVLTSFIVVCKRAVVTPFH